MPLSINQISNPPTSEQIRDTILDFLTSVGFVTTSWQEGSVQLNVIEAVADTYSGAVGTAKQLLEYTLTKPQGLWLDFVGLYRFGIPRLQAVIAERPAVLSSKPSAPAHFIAARSIVYVGTTRFFTVADTTLLPGTSQTVGVVSEFGGVAGNSTQPATIKGFSGVSVQLLAPTVKGVDVESDGRYWTRCLRRFAELTYSVGLRAYEYWTLTAAPSVNRVRAVNNYPTVNDVTIALEPGAPSEIAQVAAYVAGKHPPNDVPLVIAANPVPQLIKLRPRVLKGTTVANIQAVIDQVLSEMPLGGWTVSGLSSGRLLREKITEPLLCRNGVQTAGLEEPATDVVLGPTDYIVPTYDIELETAY